MSDPEVPRKILRTIDGLQVKGQYVVVDGTMTVSTEWGNRSVQLGEYESALAKALYILSEMYWDWKAGKGT
jgi:hypothetical protein